eukprot:scaffold5.g990.t1
MLSSGDYRHLATHLASWGVATLQPDVAVMRRARGAVPGQAMTVALERSLAPLIVAWLREQVADPGSQLFGALDLERVAVGGHSRGGKLAALVYCDNPAFFKSAVLVDADDSTCAPALLPESESNPSAARSLAAAGLPVCIVAAGIVGPANPANYGWRLFWPLAGAGSWLAVVAGAAHGQFADSGAVANAAADVVCGRGAEGVTRGGVGRITATLILAWCWHRWAAVGGAGGEGEESEVERSEWSRGAQRLPPSAGSDGSDSPRQAAAAAPGATAGPAAEPAAGAVAEPAAGPAAQQPAAAPPPPRAAPPAAGGPELEGEPAPPVALADPCAELRSMPGILAWLARKQVEGELSFRIKAEGPRPFPGLAPFPKSKLRKAISSAVSLARMGSVGRRRRNAEGGSAPASEAGGASEAGDESEAGGSGEAAAERSERGL